MALTLRFRAPLAAGLAALAAGCSSAVPPPVPRHDAEARQSQVPPASRLPFVLEAGDEVEITFYRTPELNERQIIRPDGAISLLGLPGPAPAEVRAADLTSAQLTGAVANAYRYELKAPSISVNVRAFGSNTVYVTGEVNRPGAEPIAGGMSALQAILAAQGVKSSAKLDEVLLIRPAGRGHANWQLLNLKGAYRHGDLSGDVELVPRDIVYVPRSHIGNADEFVDLYIRRLLPIQPSIGFY